MVGTGRTRYGGRPLADWVDGCIAPALARFGFGEVDIVSGWADIAGPPRRQLRRARRDQVAPQGRVVEDAQGCWGTPPPSRAAGARPRPWWCGWRGAFALELQHLAPLLIERINAHLGWRCIGKLALRQAPLSGRPARPGPAPPPKPAAVAAARDLTGGIADEALRAALVRLGARTLKAR